MNLQEFSELSVKTPNDAKLLLSLLIGHITPNEDSGKAILGLYDSFFKTYPDKKLFSPIILKFFSYHQVSNNNIGYYNDYSNMWKPPEIEDIKRRNPQWQWDKTEYKNSLEFSKALYLQIRDHNCYGFIEDNKDTFLKLLKKDKNKLEANMSKYDIWASMGPEKGYQNLLDFVEKHQFNKAEVIRAAFVDGLFRFLALFEKADTKEFISIIEDMANNRDIFEGTNFLLNRHDSRLHHQDISILDFYFITLSNDRITESNSILDNFLPEIESCLARYLYNQKNLDMTIYEKLEKVGSHIVDTLKERRGYHSGECSTIDEKKLEPKLKNLKTLVFKEKLEQTIENKETKQLKRKI